MSQVLILAGLKSDTKRHSSSALFLISYAIFAPKSYLESYLAVFSNVTDSGDHEFLHSPFASPCFERALSAAGVRQSLSLTDTGTHPRY